MMTPRPSVTRMILFEMTSATELTVTGALSSNGALNVPSPVVKVYDALSPKSAGTMHGLNGQQPLKRVTKR